MRPLEKNATHGLYEGKKVIYGRNAQKYHGKGKSCSRNGPFWAAVSGVDARSPLRRREPSTEDVPQSVELAKTPHADNAEPTATAQPKRAGKNVEARHSLWERIAAEARRAAKQEWRSATPLRQPFPDRKPDRPARGMKQSHQPVGDASCTEADRSRGRCARPPSGTTRDGRCRHADPG